MDDPPPEEPADLPVPAGRARTISAGPFEAQLMSQGVSRRGLRGGPEVLNAARTTYKKIEYSGPKDRRPRAGQIIKGQV